MKNDMANAPLSHHHGDFVYKCSVCSLYLPGPQLRLSKSNSTSDAVQSDSDRSKGSWVDKLTQEALRGSTLHSCVSDTQREFMLREKKDKNVAVAGVFKKAENKLTLLTEE